MTSHLKISILTFTLLYSSGCSVAKSNLNIARNDTTEIFKNLIDSSFYSHRLSDFSYLKRNNPFGDTIIIMFDSILVGHLPTNGKFKLLSQDQICTISSQYQNDTTLFCSLFQFAQFKKIHKNLFEVSFQNQCLTSLYNLDGTERFNKKLYKKAQTSKCNYGFISGGGIGLTFYKQNDTLKGDIQMLSID